MNNKALSIQEPYASLILTGKKLIETRGWKTNYRGELYIHACAKPFFGWSWDPVLKEIVGDLPLSCGEIICKCKLVDCVLMTEEFIKNLKEHNPLEYACGFYEVGRYAWVLTDVTPVAKIKIKGQLGIWNF